MNTTTVIIVGINIFLSWMAYLVTRNMIPSFVDKFIQSKRVGIDCHKENKPLIPESMGIISGSVFLVTLNIFLFARSYIPYNEFLEVEAALYSICYMLLLGLVDDVFDLRWRYKLLLPVLASLPLLQAYRFNFNSTTVVMPVQLRYWTGHSIDIGVFYYVYMGMLAVFCTNAINIFAGINGLEVGQSVVISVSVILFNIVELFDVNAKSHLFSLYLMLPFLAVSLGLLKYNWCPARVFVGDTYCYFAGMLFAVVGILGHFSKTLLLFFLPQIINFVYSLPQLFHFIPCPRHRFPKMNYQKGIMEPSYVEFDLKEISILGKIFFEVFDRFKLVHICERRGTYVKCNNMTLLNFALIKLGPTSEQNLTIRLLMFQVFCSSLAFTIRYPMARYFYNVGVSTQS